MQTEFKLTNKVSGVEEDVLSLNFNPTFVVATTRTQSVRFEKVENGVVNENFELEEGAAVSAVSEAKVEEAAPETAVEEEVAIEDEVADVVVDAAAGTVTEVDTATEGGDTTAETVVEEGEDTAAKTE